MTRGESWVNFKFQLGKGGGTLQPQSFRTGSNLKNRQPLNQSDTNQLKPELILQELHGLIGLTEVKKLVSEISAYVQIQKRRERARLCTEPLVLHMIFKGNPGTGKTTVARIMGKLFRSMGVLSRGHLVEVERADLVGEYIGHTAHKTREQIKRALGGILFIDEAYSLARGGEKDFGKESIDVLVKAMEDQKENLVLILAGYKREMEWFLRSNPGLYSRFPIHIVFPDYTVEELLQIGTLMLRKRQYRLHPEAETVLREILIEKTGKRNENEGNARLVRNIIERAIRRQAVRLVKKAHLTREELMTIRPEDFQ
ncbi:stage V sporulation protein K [Thermacetogenium phaeum DSM 12270]|jgi:stage V sporulation protein K|uniref:Stage V sporulation protein K n=1 Tax=Thermacetogenium phaeum (strain ATCC BAA-254 / DSM 26808 / PB) TaxID=1089553 RepID=K4LI03_THEPS|nr:AAA family ATPase [Thermacetogenium phaeum]AFV11595.1 stage V sporulation protein K [Thermacetogenium phaeum DSM 12270]MDN5365549.1 stage sporulation protein [Thermacetogenium sp.]MDN5376689.1 stage sporulation protein [Thermacetogenium sp.]